MVDVGLLLASLHSSQSITAETFGTLLHPIADINRHYNLLLVKAE